MTLPAKISTLWVVVMLNMIFADILSLFYPGTVAQLTTGTIEGVTITPMFLLVAAVFIEIAILMIFLTHALAPRAARVANLAAVVVTILFVVGGGSLSPHYVLLASVEVLALLYIGWLAWGWRPAPDAAFA